MTDEARYLEWRRSQDKREKRREATALIATAVAVELMLFLLYIQFNVGAFKGVAIAVPMTKAVPAAAVVFAVAVVAFPYQVLGAVSRALKGVAEAVLGAVTAALLLLVFAVTLPFGVLARTPYLRRHPGNAPWVRRGEDWRRSTFVPKKFEADRAAERSRTPMLRAMRVFAQQRNYFLLVVLLALLILTSVAMVAKSSVVAPFVYTLF